MPIDFIKEPSQLIEIVDELKQHQRNFILSPDRWDKFTSDCSLNWKRVDFKSGKIPSSIPNKAGVYCFCINNSNPLLPDDNYIVYVGIVGYKSGSPRTLRHRYAEYQREERTQKRVKLGYILNKWKGHLSFQYVSLPRMSLTLLEQQLLDALVPLANQNDFTAELRRAVKALS